MPKRPRSGTLRIVARDAGSRVASLVRECWLATVEGGDVVFVTCEDFVRKYGVESWSAAAGGGDDDGLDVTFVADLDGVLASCDHDPEVAATTLLYAQIDAPESEVTPSSAEVLWTHAHNSRAVDEGSAARAVVFRGRLTSPVALVQWTSSPGAALGAWRAVRASPVGRHGSPWTVYTFAGARVSADLGAAVDLLAACDEATDRLRQCLCTRFERR